MYHNSGKGGRRISLSHDGKPGLSQSLNLASDYKTSLGEEVYFISLNDFSVSSCFFAFLHVLLGIDHSS
jgi:hypothetical protein